MYLNRNHFILNWRIFRYYLIFFTAQACLSCECGSGNINKNGLDLKSKNLNVANVAYVLKYVQ